MKSAKPPGLRGYRMPAEWVPHRATWIGWPHEKEDWPGKLAPVPWAYGEFVRKLSRHELVRILVQDASAEKTAKRILQRAGAVMNRVEFHRVVTDRVWTRDSGAIFVTDARGNRIATRWKFNGWAKYPNHKHDAKVAGRMAAIAGVEAYEVCSEGQRVVMEGGSIDVDGDGLLLATEECLLSDHVQVRNPGLDRGRLERIFTEALGIRRTIWLGHGIVGDDTHGHIDDVARFVGPNRVLLCQESNANDANYRLLAENWERLRGEKVELIPLPMPSPLIFEGMRLPASYANFYVANGIVLVPTFNDSKDRHALGIIAECFPDREVIGIHCVDWVWGLGTLHCATQQEPD